MRHPGLRARSPRTAAARIGAIPGVGAVDAARCLGWLLFGDGLVWPVQRSVVVGRSPSRSAAQRDETSSGAGPVDLIVVRDPMVSRSHLLFDVARQPPEVRDTASRNGSWLVSGASVRGPLATAASLADGVEIVFGHSIVRWMEAT